MMRRRTLGTRALAGMLPLTPRLARADSRPPAGAMPLSTIVLGLERQGWGPIVEVELDDGLWEVDAWKDGRRRKLEVDPPNGRVVSDRPDD